MLDDSSAVVSALGYERSDISLPYCIYSSVLFNPTNLFYLFNPNKFIIHILLSLISFKFLHNQLWNVIIVIIYRGSCSWRQRMEFFRTRRTHVSGNRWVGRWEIYFCYILFVLDRLSFLSDPLAPSLYFG